MMIKLSGREINDYGDAIFNEDGIIDMLLSKNSTPIYSNVKNENLIPQIQFLKYSEHDETSTEYHHRLSQCVDIPDYYKTLDIRNHVLSMCSTDIEFDRVNIECDIIDKRNMNNFFRCMVYLVDIMREKNIVWGVGRGSSVSSYVLYKIGIHKIDSLFYDLDYNEFFKE